jgi:hypothetical protein
MLRVQGVSLPSDLYIMVGEVTEIIDVTPMPPTMDVVLKKT